MRLAKGPGTINPQTFFISIIVLNTAVLLLLLLLLLLCYHHHSSPSLFTTTLHHHYSPASSPSKQTGLHKGHTGKGHEPTMHLLLLFLQLSLWSFKSSAIPIFFTRPQPNSIFVAGAPIYVNANVPTDNLATFTLSNGAGYSVSQLATPSLTKTVGPTQTTTFIAPLGLTGVFLITADFVDEGDVPQQYSITITIIANAPAFGPGGFVSSHQRHQRHPRHFSLDVVEALDFESSDYKDINANDFEAFIGENAGPIDLEGLNDQCA
jgi:hypothetical protein